MTVGAFRGVNRRVLDLVLDGRWHTTIEIENALQIRNAHSRLSDLRAKHGCVFETRPAGGGAKQYRLIATGEQRAEAERLNTSLEQTPVSGGGRPGVCSSDAPSTPRAVERTAVSAGDGETMASSPAPERFDEFAGEASLPADPSSLFEEHEAYSDAGWRDSWVGDVT